MNEVLLERYCQACSSTYSDIHKGETFNLSTGHKVSYVAHPFLLEQLSVILEESSQSILSNLGSSILSLEEDGPSKIVVLEPNEERKAMVLPRLISNEDLIKLTIYFNAIAHLSSKGLPPSPEDSIFPVKNALEIPDDFMPNGLMDLVEGRPIQDYQSVLVNLNTSFAPGLVFPVFRFSEAVPIGVDSIVPLRISFKNAKVLTFNFLLETLKNRLEQFRKSESFKEFLVGRTFRTLKYSVQRGKSRELRKPLFDDDKISLLSSTGVIHQTGEIPRIRDDLSTEKIVKMSDEYEERNHEIALAWKRELIHIPGIE